MRLHNKQNRAISIDVNGGNEPYTYHQWTKNGADYSTTKFN
jgi:hypothetical protein